MEPEDVEAWIMGEAWRLVNLHDPARDKVSSFVIVGLKARLQNLRRDVTAKGRSAFYFSERPTDDHDPTEVPDRHSLRAHQRAETWVDIENELSAIRLTDAHVSFVDAVKRFPDSSTAEAARIANVSERQVRSFLQRVDPAMRGSRNVSSRGQLERRKGTHSRLGPV